MADRFHMLANPREGVERALQQRTPAIGKLAAKPPPRPGDPAPATPAAGTNRWQELFERVRCLHRDGLSVRRIANELKLHYRKVERYVRSDTCLDWNAVQLRANRPDRHAEWSRGWLRDRCSAASCRFGDGVAGGWPYPQWRMYASHSDAPNAERMDSLSVTSVGTARCPSDRSSRFSLAKASSMGFRSGLYGGRNSSRHPAASIGARAAAALCHGRLSSTTVSPGRRVGIRTVEKHSRNRAAVIGPSSTRVAVTPFRPPTR